MKYKVLQGIYSKDYYIFQSDEGCSGLFNLIKDNLTRDKAEKFIKILNKLRR